MKRRRILVTGASGMLGHSLCMQWKKHHSIFATGQKPLAHDAFPYQARNLLTGDLSTLLDWAQPEIIVHCAALTNVDLCESDRDLAKSLNTETSYLLATQAPKAQFLFISSGSVFGNAPSPKKEDSPPAPLSFYAETKRMAEEKLFSLPQTRIIRTTPVGFSPHPRGFVDWLVHSLTSRKPVTLFDDTYFSPIAMRSFSRYLLHFMENSFPKILHIAGTTTTKWDFGCQVARALDLDISLIQAGKLATAKFTAPRALDESLDCSLLESLTKKRVPSTEQTAKEVAEDYTNKLLHGPRAAA